MPKRVKCEVRAVDPQTGLTLNATIYEPEDTRDRLRYLTQEQVRALFAAVAGAEKVAKRMKDDAGGVMARRDRLLLNFIYFFGMRASEVANLRTDRVDVREETILIKGLKGGLTRTYPIRRDVLALMRGYKPGSTHYFPSPRGGAITRNRVWQIFKHYAKAAGIPAEKGEFTVHSLRHAAAVHAVDAGLQLEDVRDLLRHRRMATTEIYAVVSTKRRNDYLKRLEQSPEIVKA